jgi:hypothetical protein
LAVAVILSACAAGAHFTRPGDDVVRLGETTRAQIEQWLGKPSDETSVRQGDVVARLIQYTYANDAEAPKMPNSLCIRSLTFAFVDNVVIGEYFLSACASDHTDFDERKASAIVKGVTRCEELHSLLGRPASRAIYPVATRKGELQIGYTFQYVTRPLLQPGVYRKSLEIDCDSNGLVRGVAFSEGAER